MGTKPTKELLRVKPKEGDYIRVPDQPLSIDEGVDLINELQRRENKAWQWMLRNRWNVGLVGTHLNVVYGENTIETYADRLEMSITTVRECIQCVKYWNKDVELFEGFIITPDPDTGRPKRWYHIQAAIRSNLDPNVLGPEEFSRRLIAIMEDNNRKLEAVNEAARQMPEEKREEYTAQAKGVEQAYTDECEAFVSHGHKVISGDGMAEGTPEPVMGTYVLHRTNETPDNGKPLNAATRPQAALEALKTLGYVVSYRNEDLSRHATTKGTAPG